MKDIRTEPFYPVSEAARLLRVPASTLRAWFDIKAGRSLNFLELLEGYTIQVLRTKHQLSMRSIRRAISFLKHDTGEAYPLAMQGLGFEADRSDLYFTRLGKLVSASEQGQLAIRQVLESFLQRVEHDASGLALRFYPLTRDLRTDGPKAIVIDPALCFGRPCIASRGIATAMVASRYKAGESMAELAADYECGIEAIEEAIRAELDLQRAAA
ncbi:MAG: DUF433 domain-containing protein [Opitutaceae bacterium]